MSAIQQKQIFLEARFRRDASLSLNEVTDTPIPWDVIERDNSGFYDAAFPTQFRITKATGYYRFGGAAVFERPVPVFQDTCIFYFRHFGVGGGGYYAYSSCNGTRDMNPRRNAGVVKHLTLGDNIQAFAFHDTSGHGVLGVTAFAWITYLGS